MKIARHVAALAALALPLAAVSTMAAADEHGLDEGMVVHYPLTQESGTEVLDASGNDRHGELLGGAAWTGEDGLAFGGTNGYVRLPNDILAGIEDITVAYDVWIDPAQGTPYFIYGLGNSSGGDGNGYLFATGDRARTTLATGDWSTEQNTPQASRGNLSRGEWLTVVFTLEGSTGVMYVNGVELGRNESVTIEPGDIGGGTTTANYLGRSLYSGDSYFRGSLRDFRIYDRAISAAEIDELSRAAQQPIADADAAALDLGDTSQVIWHLDLPATGASGTTIAWESSDPEVLAADGTVHRQATDRTVTLTATVTWGSASATRTFEVTVLAGTGGDRDVVEAALAALVVHDIDDVRGNLHLPIEGLGGVTFAWSSADDAVIDASGAVNRPLHGSGDVSVPLTVQATYGDAELEEVLTAVVRELPQAEDLEGYLFSYFLGEGLQHGEQVYFALSEGNDPLAYSALNDGEPVMISTSGEMGLRDPYIIRSPEGDKFYQIATDLRMWNQSSGSWDQVQRHGSRNIVVWESTDLVNWSDSWVAEVAPPNAGNAWAPEIFYDESIGEYVVFWASKLYGEDDPDHTGAAYNRMMYATTRDFRNFSEPGILIDEGYSVIDTTMIEHDGTIYRFSKNEADRSQGNPGGKHVFQESGSSPLADDFTLIREAVGAGDINQGEGPLVFKSNTEERWYLFIDEYGGRGYVPFTTTDLGSGEWTMVQAADYSFSHRFRHGSVLPITGSEWQALQAAYGDPDDAGSVALALEALAIPNVDDVRGNITLPTSGDQDVELSWASSAPEVIAPDGVVTRPAHGGEPVQVTLTVTATKGEASATRTFVATVVPLPEEQEMEAYFFPHFKGESTPDGEQVYFAASNGNNALDWLPLNDDEPVIRSTMGEEGLRDPFIIRSPEGDRFFLVVTDLKTYRPGQGPDFARAQQTGSRSLMIWESTDLVNWGDQRMVEVSSPYAGNTWAPEAHYDESLGAYVVYWASNLYPTTETEGRDTRESYNRMMYSITRDFVTFTEPEIWIDIRRGPGRGMIDSTVVEHDGMFYRFTKDERNDIMEVLLEKSPDLLRYQEGAVGTTWELITERIGSGDPLRHAEGPTAFKANAGDASIEPGVDTWFLFQDWPPYGGGDGYVAFSSTDLDDGESWTYRPELNLSARHGTVLPITQLEWEGLIAAYGEDAEPEVVTEVADVVFVDEPGTEDDRYVVPTTEGVEYLVGDVVVEAGSYPGSGTVVVTARALDGWVLAPEATSRWEHTFSTGPEPEPTSPEPTSPEPTSPEPSPTDPEPTDPEPTDPSPTDPGPGGPSMPDTGAAVGAAVALAMVLMAAGLVLRRRHAALD